MADRSLHYVLVDVFARTPFAGNQLAVVLGADGLSTYQMQRIAAEFNLSEAAFPVARTPADEADGADYRVRIFTSSVEIPFAGHPTLGTAWVLADRGLVQPGQRLQACQAGLIDVHVPADLAAPLELGARPRDLSARLSADAAIGCARSVGLRAADVAGEAVVAGCGLSWVHLQVHEESLARSRPRLTDMSDVDLGGYLPLDPLIGLNVFAVTGALAEGSLPVRSRVFVPGAVPEDPATGSAAVGLGVALVSTGLAGSDGLTRYEIQQGAEMGRPSFLSGRVDASDGIATRCWVAGQVVSIGEGTIRIP